MQNSEPTRAMRTPLRMIAIRPGTSTGWQEEARKPPVAPEPEPLGKTKHSHMRALFRLLLKKQLRMCYSYFCKMTY